MSEGGKKLQNGGTDNLPLWEKLLTTKLTSTQCEQLRSQTKSVCRHFPKGMMRGRMFCFEICTQEIHPPGKPSFLYDIKLIVISGYSFLTFWTPGTGNLCSIFAILHHLPSSWRSGGSTTVAIKAKLQRELPGALKSFMERNPGHSNTMVIFCLEIQQGRAAHKIPQNLLNLGLNSAPSMNHNPAMS